MLHKDTKKAPKKARIDSLLENGENARIPCKNSENLEGVGVRGNEIYVSQMIKESDVAEAHLNIPSFSLSRKFSDGDRIDSQFMPFKIRGGALQGVKW